MTTWTVIQESIGLRVEAEALSHATYGAVKTTISSCRATWTRGCHVTEASQRETTTPGSDHHPGPGGCDPGRPGEEACEPLPRWNWGLPVVYLLTDGDAEQIGKFSGRLNQVTSDFGPPVYGVLPSSAQQGTSLVALLVELDICMGWCNNC